MAAIVTKVLKDSGSKFGDFYSWWLPGPPKDGEMWGAQERIRGDIFSVSHRRSSDGKYRTGGPFYSIKFHTNIVAQNATVFRYLERKAYYGRFLPTPTDKYVFSYTNMSSYDTDSVNSLAFSYGAQAYAALRPDKPDFSPVLSLAELLREIPSYQDAFKTFNKRYYAELRRLGSKGIVLSRSGKYHLAIQFGIMPIISDITNWIDAYKGAQKRAEQLLRDNGKWVRRRARLSPKPSEEFGPVTRTNYNTGYHPALSPTLVTQCYSSTLKAYTLDSQRRTIEVWAVGKSKYFLPDDILRSSHKMDILKRRIHTNLEFNVETIYNLIPWSWLVDYYTSLGSFFAQFSGGIGETIVFDYAYVMRKEEHVRKRELFQGVLVTVNTVGYVSSTIYQTATLKTRVAASIFGFGIKETELSPAQLGILGALGLSKL